MSTLGLMTVVALQIVPKRPKVSLSLWTVWDIFGHFWTDLDCSGHFQKCQSVQNCQKGHIIFVRVFSYYLPHIIDQNYHYNQSAVPLPCVSQKWLSMDGQDWKIETVKRYIFKWDSSIEETLGGCKSLCSRLLLRMCLFSGLKCHRFAGWPAEEMRQRLKLVLL